MAPRLLNLRSMPSSASREEAPTGGGRCGEGPGPWGHPEPGEDGGLCGEHVSPKTWGRAPSPFAIGSGAHRCLSHAGTWPPLFVATDNNNKHRGNTCLRRET